MVDIQPMYAIRYPIFEQTGLVSPPYDVLALQDKQSMLARNANNIVAVDLPHVPPKVAGPLQAYAHAASQLQAWLDSGVLVRDDVAALFPYEQTYTHEGRMYHRRGLFGRVRLEEFGGTGTIHPHEQTFSGPKEDRLLLTRATRCNISPVFGLYDDPHNAVTESLFAKLDDPIAEALLPSMDGQSRVKSTLWRVASAHSIRHMQKLLADKHLYIADGHHRYGTSLNYRRERVASNGTLPHDHPANFVMFVLVAMQDPGLIIMPTHRTVSNLKGFTLDKFMAAAGSRLKLATGEKFHGDQLPALEKRLPSFGAHAMAVYDPAADKAVVVMPTTDDPLREFLSAPTVADHSAAWRSLDVAILQELVFDQIVKPHFAAGGDVSWAFPHEAQEVLRLCHHAQHHAGFILQPTPLKAVRDLCNHNELMPQKSTFFYPKLATGMLINPLF